MPAGCRHTATRFLGYDPTVMKSQPLTGAMYSSFGFGPPASHARIFLNEAGLLPWGPSLPLTLQNFVSCAISPGLHIDLPIISQ